MLYFILVWVSLLIGCVGIGTALLNKLNLVGLERDGDRFITAVWLGLVALSVSLLAIALLTPLSPLVGMIAFTSLLVISLWFKQTRIQLRLYKAKLSGGLILRFAGVVTILAAIMSRQVTWVDTGYYHYSLIQWLAKFGTVPGIALLHRPLGFTSSWFALAAPLNPEIFDARVSAVTTGFAVLTITLQVWICTIHVRQRQGKIADWFTIATLLIACLLTLVSKTLKVILVSPSPDPPVMLLLIVVAWLFLITSDSAATTRRSALDARLIPLVLAAGAVTMKLTAIPLLAVASLFYVLAPGQRMQRLLIGSITVAVILAPLSISGIVTSGCSFYPATSLCFDLPWLPTADSLEKVANRTHRWISWYGDSPTNLHEWMTLGWTWLTAAKRNQAVIVFSFISTLCTVYIMKHSVKPRSQGYLWVIATGILGIGFFMLTSPLLRFQLAYLILIPGLLAAHYAVVLVIRPAERWLSLFSKRFDRHVIHISTACLATLVIAYTNAFSHLMLPPPLPKAEVVRKQVNDVFYFYPLDSERRICWASPLPCTTVQLQDIQLRDSTRGISGGFVRSSQLFSIKTRN